MSEDIRKIIDGVKKGLITVDYPIMHHGRKICGGCGVTGEVYHKKGCKLAIDLIGTYDK